MTTLNEDQQKELEKVIQTLDSKFTSGNSIPVERNTITRKEWNVLRQAIMVKADIQTETSCIQNEA